MKLTIPDREFGGYIFDCDGTLADTMPLHYRAWTRIVGELGGTFPKELFYRLGGKPTAQILCLLRDEHGLKVGDVHAAAVRKEEYFLEMIDEVKPIEAVVQFARRWHGVKPLAVASGGFHRQIERTLEALKIRLLFSAVVCAEDYARGKPYPDPFLIFSCDLYAQIQLMHSHMPISGCSEPEAGAAATFQHGKEAEAAVDRHGLILAAETRIMGMTSETRRYGNNVGNESGNARLRRVQARGGFEVAGAGEVRLSSTRLQELRIGNRYRARVPKNIRRYLGSNARCDQGHAGSGIGQKETVAS